MGMLNKIGPALKAQSWLQPFLYRVYYIFKILTNGGEEKTLRGQIKSFSSLAVVGLETLY